MCLLNFSSDRKALRCVKSYSFHQSLQEDLGQTLANVVKKNTATQKLLETFEGMCSVTKVTCPQSKNVHELSG